MDVDHQGVTTSNGDSARMTLPYTPGTGALVPKQSLHMRLLMLDFISKALIERGRLFLQFTKSMLGTDNISNENNIDLITNDNSKGRPIRALNHNIKMHALHKCPYIITPLAEAAWNSKSHPHGREHYAVLSHVGIPNRISSGAYPLLYAFAETEIRRLFGIMIPEPRYDEEEDTMDERVEMELFTSYIHSVEAMLHYLSNKPSSYPLILCLAVTMMMRNLLRIIEGHEISMMLVEFTILCSEALKLSQNFIYEFCVSLLEKETKRYATRARTKERNEEDDSESSKQQDIETMHSLLQVCNKCRDIVMRHCKPTSRYYTEVECEILHPKFSRPTTSPRRSVTKDMAESESNKNSHAQPYLNSIEREKQKFEQSQHMNEKESEALSDFKAKVEPLLLKWNVELCRLVITALGVIGDSSFTKYRNIYLGAYAGVPVMSFKRQRDQNLSRNRELVIVKAMKRRLGKQAKQKTVKKAKAQKKVRIVTPPQEPILYKPIEGELGGTPREVIVPPKDNDAIANVDIDPDVDSLPEADSVPLSIDVHEDVTPLIDVNLSEDAEEVEVVTEKKPSTRKVHAEPEGKGRKKLKEEKQQQKKKANVKEAPSRKPSQIKNEPEVALSGKDESSEDVDSATPPVDEANREDDDPLKQQTGRRSRLWKPEEVTKLVEAVNKHGAGRWSFFAYTYFGGTKTGSQLKDKWCNLTRYKHVHQELMEKGRGNQRRTLWKVSKNI